MHNGMLLARIRHSQRHLLGLIDGVLDFARGEAGGVRYELSDVGIAHVLTLCDALAGPQIATRGIALDLRLPEPDIFVRADQAKLQQIVVNLLGNATKFTEPGGTIIVSAARLDGDVLLTVCDTGRGIPADKLEAIFEPFVQVDAQLTRKQEGIGLGLSISRDLARGMLGDLTVSSSYGEGSTFTLRLPAARTNPE